MSNLNYFLRMADRADLSADEYHAYLKAALEAWQNQVRHEKQDRVRNLKHLQPHVDFSAHAVQEDIRRTIRALEEELGVSKG